MLHNIQIKHKNIFKHFSGYGWGKKIFLCLELITPPPLYPEKELTIYLRNFSLNLLLLLEAVNLPSLAIWDKVKLLGLEGISCRKFSRFVLISLSLSLSLSLLSLFLTWFLIYSFIFIQPWWLRG